MKAILETRCGCKQEIDVACITQDIKIPLKFDTVMYRSGEVIVVDPKRTMGPYSYRVTYD